MSVAGGNASYGGGGRHRCQRARRDRCSRRVAVLALVGHHQHRRVVGGALHVLPRRATTHGAALVVAPWVRGALDGFLAVLPPRVLVRRDVGDLGADRRHSDSPLHTVLPARPIENPINGQKTSPNQEK
uniref:Uncharacterized protein n=1 Tax=Arundo donax TaxID=35708 RepID=A0A0A9EM18_ARUDO